jgi:transposase
LAVRTLLVRQRCEVDNQIRGLLKTFGIRIGKAPGGITKRAAAIAADELAPQPELAHLVRMLLELRATLCDQIADLDGQLIRQARSIPVCRRFMTVPGLGVVVALSVWAAIDDPGRFVKSPSVGAYLGLTPRAATGRPHPPV